MKKNVMSLLFSFLLIVVGLAGLSTSAEAFGLGGDTQAAIVECKRDENPPYGFVVHIYSHSSRIDDIAIGTDCAVALSTLEKYPNYCKILDSEYLLRNLDRSILYTLTCR